MNKKKELFNIKKFFDTMEEKLYL